MTIGDLFCGLLQLAQDRNRHSDWWRSCVVIAVGDPIRKDQGGEHQRQGMSDSPPGAVGNDLAVDSPMLAQPLDVPDQGRHHEISASAGFFSFVVLQQVDVQVWCDALQPAWVGGQHRPPSLAGHQDYLSGDAAPGSGLV